MTHLTIQATSEGKRENDRKDVPGKALITVNGINVIDVSGLAKRGIHAVVIDPNTGNVTSKDYFQTYDTYDEGTRLAQFITAIPAGQIVALAVCDEGSRFITGTGADGGRRNQSAIDALKTLGSTKVEQLKWRDSWVLIGHKDMLPDEATVELLRHNMIASAEFTRDHIIEIKASSEGKVERNNQTLAHGSANIIVNGIVVIDVKNESSRGLHVAVVDETTGVFLDKQHFKTHDTFEEASRLADFINQLPDGRIVALAVCDEGSANITGVGASAGRRNEAAVAALKTLGSSQIEKLGWRYSWALVGHKGIMRSQTLESMAPDSKATLSVPFKKRRPICIEAKSAVRPGDSVGEASLIVNGTIIYDERGDKENCGLYVTLIDHQDGSVIETQRFARSSREADADTFVSYMNAIPAGPIVVVATCGEAPAYLRGSTTPISPTDLRRKASVVAACSALGSKEVDQLVSGDRWLLIGQKGSTKTIAVQEKRTRSGDINLSSTIASRSTSLTNTPNVDGISSRITLAEDYEPASGGTPIAVHRAIISLPLRFGNAELTAEQDVDVQINGKAERLSPVKPLTVTPNPLRQIVITKKANNLGVPAIKVRTAGMTANEAYIINLDSHAYQKLSNLPPSALHNARIQLGIKEGVTEKQCHDAQQAIVMLASTHHSTYNEVTGAKGVCRDRYVRPDNMEYLHWKYSTHSGVTRLSQQEAFDLVRDAKFRSSAGQFFGEGIWDAIAKGADVVVHTVKADVMGIVKQGENLVKTAGDLVSDAANTAKNVITDEFKGATKVADDLVHGNFSGALSDIHHMETDVVRDIITGGENTGADLIKGGKNALVIYVDTGKEMLQYPLDHTGKLGEAIKGFLNGIAAEGVNILENVLAWLAQKIGWDDVLKVHKALETMAADWLDRVPDGITQLKGRVQVAITSAKKNVDTEIQALRQRFGARGQQFQSKPAQQLMKADAQNSAKEETDWLMSKVMTDSDGSDMFSMPAPPQDLSDGIDNILKCLSDKFGADSMLVKAIKNVEEDFRDLFAGSLADAPDALMRIALDLLEIIAEGALDLASALVDGVFAVLLKLVDYFKQLIKQPINLPFITDLYEKLTRGSRPKGEQLTVLGFTTLLVAIPAKLSSQYYGVNLASKIPGAGQSLSTMQFWFGILYASCQLAKGILVTALDCTPPAHLKDLKNLKKDIEKGLKNRSYVILNEGQTYLFTVVSWIIGGVAQGLFGTPSGDTRVYKPGEPWGLLECIWVFQWVIFFWGVIGDILGMTGDILKKNWSVWTDVFLIGSCLLELVHIFAFIVFNNIDTNSDKGSGLIHFAYAMDPCMGILRVGRTKYALELTGGSSFLYVVAADMVFQTLYYATYLGGTFELNNAP